MNLPGSLQGKLALVRHFASRIKGDLIYAVASLITSAIAFQGTIVAARSLSPTELGIMQTLLLIPTYCTFLHLGVFNGLNRNIAYYIGRKDHARVQEMVNSSWMVSKIVSGVGLAIAFVFIAWYVYTEAGPLYYAGMAAVLVALVLEPFSQHAEIVFMGTRNFQALGARVHWQNLVTGIGNMLPVVAGAWGYAASRGIFSAARLIFRLPRIPIAANGAGKVTEVKDLAVTGMPLLIAGVLYGYLGVADRSVIACFLGPEAMGQYSLSAIVVAATQLVPFCLATIFYPRLAACYGEMGSARALRRYYWILLAANLAAVLPIAVALYLFIGPLTRLYLPKYSDGIEAARIASMSSVFFVYMGVGGIIAVVKRNTPYIVAIGIALITVWLLGTVCVRNGYGIVGAVWARTIASALLCAFTLVYTYLLTGRE